MSSKLEKATQTATSILQSLLQRESIDHDELYDVLLSFAKELETVDDQNLVDPSSQFLRGLCRFAEDHPPEVALSLRYISDNDLGQKYPAVLKAYHYMEARLNEQFVPFLLTRLCSFILRSEVRESVGYEGFVQEVFIAYADFVAMMDGLRDRVEQKLKK